MNEKRFEELLRETAEAYNRPPETPADQMWAEIQRRRRGGSLPEPARVHWWRRPVVLVPLAAAAALLVGVGIGRWTTPLELGPGTISDGGSPLAVGPAAPGGGIDEDAFFRAAASRHLQQTETLLTLFALDSPATDDLERQQRVHRWARQLLGDTRLLMDSPAAADATLRQLLTDLEIFLARIVQVSGESLDHEKTRINDDLRNRGILMRLRSQIPAGHV